MKSKVFAVLSVVLFATLGSTSAFAQDHSRGWDSGHVVQVTEVHTKDGMFNAYINDLNNVWRKFLEAQKKDGYVIGYGMYSNVNQREGEPDLYLTVTYKNWAAFDRGIEYFEKLSADIMGSNEKMRVAGIDRGALRTIGSTYTLQELTFKE
jgi:hypothetical protein